MTLGEFRAWLNGYECSFDLNADGYWPNAKQFTEIKEKLALVDRPERVVFTGVKYDGPPPTPWPGPNDIGKPIGEHFAFGGPKTAGGLCAPSTSGMDDWHSRDIYAPLAGKPI